MKDVKSHLQNSNDELLIVLNEECAEVQKAISKVLRFGKDNYSPGKDFTSNIFDLEKEVGDLLAIINLLFYQHQLDKTKIENYAKDKELNHWKGLTPLQHDLHD